MKAEGRLTKPDSNEIVDMMHVEIRRLKEMTERVGSGLGSD